MLRPVPPLITRADRRPRAGTGFHDGHHLTPACGERRAGATDESAQALFNARIRFERAPVLASLGDLIAIYEE